jgi:hypothetical protein
MSNRLVKDVSKYSELIEIIPAVHQIPVNEQSAGEWLVILLRWRVHNIAFRYVYLRCYDSMW